ncbi:hypothetical protein CRG98_000049 [Punica granatum]|uniref:phospholipase D n=1 Tax=Punica granatum TaxID=22663 RepID=A0A2I0LFX4_PUNGR|nr:hypothetical protein CRG98_000049 [Punica granatum]
MVGQLWGFTSAADAAPEHGLIHDRGKVIERSIPDAHINSIRRAKIFIYIENQYFLGSSFCWKNSDGLVVEDVGATNLIPKELSIKIISKIATVDDEYIIIGSANINQRSMDGSRDTQIAMGGYQPHHLATKSPARGQIYGFWMALWHEHIGELHDCFDEPQSLQCIRKVSEITGKNWYLYSRRTLECDRLPGHLLTYPVGELPRTPRLSICLEWNTFQILKRKFADPNRSLIPYTHYLIVDLLAPFVISSNSILYC